MRGGLEEKHGMTYNIIVWIRYKIDAAYAYELQEPTRV